MSRTAESQRLQEGEFSGEEGAGWDTDHHCIAPKGKHHIKGTKHIKRTENNEASVKRCTLKSRCLLCSREPPACLNVKHPTW